MYVCICKAITERQVIAAAERGAVRLSELRADLGVPGNCGRCARCARAILLAVRDRRAAPRSSSPAVA